METCRGIRHDVDYFAYTAIHKSHSIFAVKTLPYYDNVALSRMLSTMCVAYRL